MVNTVLFCTTTRRIALTLVFALCFAACGKRSVNELTFADASDVWWTAPTIIARSHNLFEAHQVNGLPLKIKTFDVTSGLASKNAVVSRAADVGLVAATPLAMGAYKKEKITILCSYVESSSLIALLRRKDADREAPTVLIDPPVAVVPSTISEWYYWGYLKKHGLKKDFRELHVKPPDLPNVLKNGDARSGVIWEPFASLASEDFEAIREPDIYTLRLFLISRPDVVETKPAALEAFVASVNAACAEIAKNPEGSREELERRFGYSAGWLKGLWSKVDFTVRKDWPRMRELILADAQNALELGHAPDRSLPDIEYLFPPKGIQ